MAPVTRRGFLRTTSMGAAAIGVLSAVPTMALAASPTTMAPEACGPTPLAVGPGAALPVRGAPFLVYVNEPSSGSGTILVGEQAIPFTNPTIVQSLQQALG